MSDQTSPRVVKAVPRLAVGNDDLKTVREVQRSLGQLVEQLEAGEASQFVITRHGKMAAILLPLHAVAALREESHG